MFCEEIRVPGLPGAEDVTDGSVESYEMDWENVDNGATEDEMPKCPENPCTSVSQCSDNSPDQSDDNAYEISLLPDTVQEETTQER